MTEEIKNVTAVMAGTRLGNGAKIHLTIARVSEEKRFGRMMKVHRIEQVECGAAKTSGWARSAEWGVIELGEEFEVDLNQPAALYFASYRGAAETLASAREKIGKDLCGKCERAYEKVADWQAKKALESAS